MEENISIKFDRVSLRALSKWSLIIESEESWFCPIVIRRSDSIRFRQENERSPSALDKRTVKKIDNQMKILRKKDFKLSLAKWIRVSSMVSIFLNEEFDSSAGKSLISSKFSWKKFYFACHFDLS